MKLVPISTEDAKAFVGLVQIPINRSVHLFRRNGISLVCDASRAHVGDRVLLHGQPWDAEKMRVIRTHRSR